MILRHKIVNFKSFREAEIEFKDFNLLIGRNATGKTNLVQSLDFLAHVIREKNLIGARSHLGVTPIDSVTHIHTNSRIFSFEIDLEVNDDVLFYKIEIQEADNSTKTLTVLNEKLTDHSGATVFTRNDNNVFNGEGRNIPLSVESTDLAISLIKDGKATLFRNKISKIFLSNNINFEERDIASLDPKHLPSLLNLLYEKHAEDYVKFETVAKKIIPSFNGFQTFNRGGQKDNASLLFLLRQVEGQNYFSTYASSTGDMKTLYILAALFSKATKSTLIIEEIENGFHPERMKLVLEFIQSIASKREVQLIITTHSPNVIEVCPLNKIQFLYLENGESKITRIEHYMTTEIREQLEKGGDISAFLRTLKY